MTRRPLVAVSIPVSKRNEASVTALMAKVFRQYPAVYREEKTGRSTATAYLDANWDRSTGLHLRRALENLGVDWNSVQSHKLPRERWAESWKKHFKAFTVGGKLLVQPGWSRRKPRRGQARVILDPGLSFGTGQHPTTRFCLEQIVRFRANARSFLDVGTGSGILAIAAAKLGYGPIQAFDSDPDAIRIAVANARANRVGRRIVFACADLARFLNESNRTWDLICANLTHDLLLQEARGLTRILRKNGRLVLSGILRFQFQRVERRFGQAGLRLENVLLDEGWKSAVLR